MASEARRVFEFRRWLAEHGYSPRTQTLYGSYLLRAEAWCVEHEATIDRAPVRLIEDWYRHLPPTRSSRQGAKYALMTYYKSRGRKDGGPARELPLLPPPHRLPRPLSAADYERWLDAARQLGGRQRVVGEILAYTAARFTEVRTARWEAFDLDGEPPTWLISGKGSNRRGAKPRLIPLRAELVSTLRAWRGVDDRRSEYLFPGRRGPGAVNAATIGSDVATLAGVAGLDGVTAHRLRHTVATLALERTGDLRGLQEFLGHASLQSTQVYTGVIASRLEDITAALGTRP